MKALYYPEELYFAIMTCWMYITLFIMATCQINDQMDMQLLFIVTLFDICYILCMKKETEEWYERKLALLCLELWFIIICFKRELGHTV